MSWEPIATAPRDGSYLLGYVPGQDHPPYSYVLMRWDGLFFVEESEMYNVTDATHWMQLPEAPK